MPRPGCDESLNLYDLAREAPASAPRPPVTDRHKWKHTADGRGRGQMKAVSAATAILAATQHRPQSLLRDKTSPRARLNMSAKMRQGVSPQTKSEVIKRMSNEELGALLVDQDLPTAERLAWAFKIHLHLCEYVDPATLDKHINQVAATNSSHLLFLALVLEFPPVTRPAAHPCGNCFSELCCLARCRKTNCCSRCWHLRACRTRSTTSPFAPSYYSPLRPSRCLNLRASV